MSDSFSNHKLTAILAESASILRLVSSAVAIQRELADRNAEFRTKTRFRFESA